MINIIQITYAEALSLYNQGLGVTANFLGMNDSIKDSWIKYKFNFKSNNYPKFKE